MPENKPKPEPEESGRLQFLYRLWLKKTKFEEPPADVKKLFNEFSNKNIMPKAELQRFLTTHQGLDEGRANDCAQKIIASRNFKGIRNCSRHGLSENGFLQFLLSKKYNPPLNYKKLKDSKELAHYFVYTSHHSYFKQKTKSQHQSNTSDEKQQEDLHNNTKAIKKALKNGVKVIELDLFPSSDETDIHVRHPRRTEGPSQDIRTLKDCLEAINEKAFCTSYYPVIVILEEHFEAVLPQNALKLQKRLNKLIYKKIGEEKLYTEETAFYKLPLNSLKKKIIILKRRRAQQELTTRDKNEVTEEEEKYIAGYVEELKDEFQNQPTLSPGKPKILRMKENYLENSKSSEIIRFTQENLLAVKPQDFDYVKHSNYDPLSCWKLGIQMAAFNMQDACKHLNIMQGLFRAQGNGPDGTGEPTGYVEKPLLLMNRDEIFDPEAWQPVKRILKVKVYLGTGWHLDFDSKQFDKSSHPDFFTAVEIIGVPEDEAREKTIPASDQLIPSWDQEFEFPLTVPQLAMLMIEVREFDVDRTHDFAGQTCLPVCQLKEGTRCVPLYNKKGNPYRAARLLMRFQFE